MMIATYRILVVLAGLMGAGGVILAAAAAHDTDATRLAAASSMLQALQTGQLNAATSAARNPGSTTISLFNRHTCEYRDRLIPRFTASENASGFGLCSTMTRG